MGTLVSPGVESYITNDSFFLPSSSPTVPLLFIATRANKTQPDGVSSAVGTTESGVVRTVTSIGQSTQLYGIPYFRTDSSGNAFNGDARNEYGLFALNQYLNVGNLAYVVRANIDLTDAATQFIGIGTPVATNPTFVGVGTGTININSIATVGVPTGGTGYTAGTYTSVPLTGGAGSGALATITVVSSGGIATLNTLVAGSSYTNGTYTNVALTNVTGTGTGARATVVVAAGVVSTVTITTAGTGYAVGNTLSATASTIGGTGTGFTINVSSISPLGTVTGVSITSGGYGYAVGNTLSASASSIGGTGTGFSVNVATLNAGITATSAFVQPQTIDVVFSSATAFTVQGSLAGIIGTGTVGTAFTSTIVNFTVTNGGTAFSGDDYFQFNLVYAPSSYSGTGNGTMTSITPGVNARAETWTIIFTSATTFSVNGSVTGPTASGTIGSAYSNNYINFTITVGTTAFVVNDEFQLILSTVNLFNPLGANDAAKRVTITTALAAAINNNTEVRSDIYQYNLILCPGYWEVVNDLLALSVSINSEAFVIADTPSTNTCEQTVQWAATSARQNSTSLAYYYPWGQATNLDGTTVVVPPSGIALATYAYSDSISYVWFAPAGATRGIVTGITALGYVSGAPGTAAAFTQVNLNQGQRDSLYQDFTNINPIVYFPSQGMLIWGQKTSANADSSLDRVNAMRCAMYISRQLRIGAFPFVFEPNDSITQANLASAVSSFLNGVLTNRGLYDFVVLCNASNNPPSVVQNNELYCDVGIQIVTSAEFIYLPVVVYSLSATLPS